MKTMPWSAGRGWGVALALGALAVAARGPVAFGGAPLVAQERERGEECRCVDRDGNEIENCRCLRTPRMVLTRAFESRGARLGITLDGDQDAADDARGARVASVMDGGPADEAGLREGDVITSVDGRSLLEPLGGEAEDRFDLDDSLPVQRLMALAREMEAGDEVEIGYLRDGAHATTTVEAGDLSPWVGLRGLEPRWDAEAMALRMGDLGDRLRGRTFTFQAHADLRCPGGEPHGFVFGDSAGCVEGMELTEMKPGLAGYFGTEEGVLVTDVEDDSPLGIEAGDVILAIHGRDVRSPGEVRRILGSYGPDEDVSFRVMRHRQETTVEGRRAR